MAEAVQTFRGGAFAARFGPQHAKLGLPGIVWSGGCMFQGAANSATSPHLLRKLHLPNLSRSVGVHDLFLRFAGNRIVDESQRVELPNGHVSTRLPQRILGQETLFVAEHDADHRFGHYPPTDRA